MIEHNRANRSSGKGVFRRAALIVLPLLTALVVAGWAVHREMVRAELRGVAKAESVWQVPHEFLWGGLAFLSVLMIAGGVYVAYTWELHSAMSRALKENDEMFAALSDAVAHPIFFWGTGGEYIGANHAFASLMGMPCEKSIEGTRIDSLPNSQGQAMAKFLGATSDPLVQAGIKHSHELTLTKPGGGAVHYLVSQATFRRSKEGEIASAGIMVDLTKQKAIEKDLLQIRAALDDSTDAVLITDESGTPIYINAVFGYWFGYTPDQMESIDLDRLYGGPGRFDSIIAPILAGDNISEDMVLSTYYERVFNVHLRGSAIVDEHFDIAGALFLHTDVTEQKRLESELEQLSRIDGLTGIHNRRSFDERLAHEWRRARRERSRLSLIMLDIDAFKRYNDHYGHQEGDACLKQVATGVAETFQRPSDFVARYGGEEFAIIIADHGDALTVAQAERLRGHIESLALPHADSPSGDVVTISVGLAAMTPNDVDEETELIQLADEALYRAKDRGRNRVCHNGVDLP